MIRPQPLSNQRPGFALIASLGMLVLLAAITLGMLTMATVELRSKRSDFHQAEAEANARLALMVAIGELQRELGPDQRVSAPSAILENPNGSSIAQPHWVGVWSSQYRDDQAMWIREPRGRGLIDQRVGSSWDREAEVRNYLVSGNEGGREKAGGLPYLPQKNLSDQESIGLVQQGSAGDDERAYVSVPEVPLVTKGITTGKYAYWIGDLGTRANVSTRSPYELADDTVEKTYPFLAASEAAPEVMDGGATPLTILEDEKSKLISTPSLDLLRASSKDWRRDLFHDLTVQSAGVLSDVREGGMKQNLSIFLNQNQDLPAMVSGPSSALPGLAALDNLVGPANPQAALLSGESWIENRHQESSPTFGLLRDWARLAESASLTVENVETRNPATEIDYELPEILAKSSQNLNPAALRQVTQANLNPILVEASLFRMISAYDNLNVVEEKRYNLRSHLFPRVTLWNPYSVPIRLAPSIAMMQVNGRRAFMTDYYEDEIFRGYVNWISWGGRAPTNPDVSGAGLVASDGFNDQYTGSFYFALPETIIESGQCLVFLPDQTGEYNGGGFSPEADDPDARPNLLKNTLAPDSSYLPRFNYYISSSVFSNGIRFLPTEYWYTPANNRHWFADGTQKVQGDDSQMILKSLADWTQDTLTLSDFDLLPQIAAVSCSLQYGAGKEPTEAWSDGFPRRGTGVPIPYLTTASPQFRLTPDRKTRQGYRLRWFEEHVSHLGILGNPLRDQPEFWQESFLGSWNLRASYSARTPFENLAGNLGDNNASGPWFFGIYTKDLYDETVGWRAQTPIRRSGKNHGNPFGTPDEAAERYVLFDLPRKEIGIVSLAQLQHAKVSELVWHPSYAIGNSLIDPRLGIDGAHGTQVFSSEDDQKNGGFSKNNIGWSNNSERGLGQDAWAEHGRAFFLNTPDEETLIYDLSFELNHTLWDRYFLSSGTPQQLDDFLDDPRNNPLPNARITLRRDIEVTPEDLQDLHLSSSTLMLDGAFNVNSTSVEAWKALLSANRRDDGLTPFPRLLGEERGEWQSNSPLDPDLTWNGTRVLNDTEIELLAIEIVKQVKERGPFLSVSDFINRRLTNDSTSRHGFSGPLETAIRQADINAALDSQEPYAMDQDDPLRSYSHPDNILKPTRMEQTMKPPSLAWGAPIYITQADLLQTIGSSLAARSDTFVIRTYGESLSGTGQVQAKAWCEAVVQRLPTPIRPDRSGINPEKSPQLPNFGRRFVIQSFRWLNPSEV